METWIFDRAGAYSSKAFNIVQEPHRFKHIVTAYMLMDDNELGLNPVLRQDDKGLFLGLKEPNQPWGARLSVDKTPFVMQDYLVGPGTTCFKAYIPDKPGQGLVVKLSWEQNEQSAEQRLLRFANEKGVWGLPKLESHQCLGDIARLRCGLRCDQPYEFSLPLPDTKDKDEAGQSLASTLDTPLPAKQDANSSQVQHKTEAKFDNLRLECVVTSPLGRTLDNFSSTSQLMSVLADIVKALRSLYLQAGILHRDVSPQNIIIVPHQEYDAPTGMLIDLDLALDLTNPPSERRLIGSRGFMAIGILGGDYHTYRHDLESLFYVFLWMAICHDGTVSYNIPETSRLNAWRGTDFLAVFHKKKQDMQPTEFSKLIEEEFTQPFRRYLPLAKSLHDLLFPVRHGRIFIGTDHDPSAMERLYASLMDAFKHDARHD